jgi:hypothetical protein
MRVKRPVSIAVQRTVIMPSNGLHFNNIEDQTKIRVATCNKTFGQVLVDRLHFHVKSRPHLQDCDIQQKFWSGPREQASLQARTIYRIAMYNKTSWSTQASLLGQVKAICRIAMYNKFFGQGLVNRLHLQIEVHLQDCDVQQNRPGSLELRANMVDIIISPPSPGHHTSQTIQYFTHEGHDMSSGIYELQWLFILVHSGKIRRKRKRSFHSQFLSRSVLLSAIHLVRLLQLRLSHQISSTRSSCTFSGRNRTCLRL